VHATLRRGRNREAAVERAYGAFRPASEHVEAVRAKLGEALAGMHSEAEREATRQRRRLAALTDQRTKLLHAYYDGAVPLELLRQEQDRLSSEIEQAEAQFVLAEQSFADVATTLDKALDLLADCERAYANAPGQLRRQWNQALFERFVIRDEDVEEASFAEPFATLVDPYLPRRLSRSRRTAAVSGDGSNKGPLVGAAGFEPAISATQRQRDTRFRYAPFAAESSSPAE
jgi:site-specific DNA recombinase